jgi:hypothetical protein
LQVWGVPEWAAVRCRSESVKTQAGATIVVMDGADWIQDMAHRPNMPLVRWNLVERTLLAVRRHPLPPDHDRFVKYHHSNVNLLDAAPSDPTILKKLRATLTMMICTICMELRGGNRLVTLHGVPVVDLVVFDGLLADARHQVGMRMKTSMRVTRMRDHHSMRKTRLRCWIVGVYEAGNPVVQM